MVSNKVRLSEIADIIMGQSPKGDSCNNSGLGMPLLNGPTEFGTTHPFPTQFTNDPKKVSKVGDILFCVRGSTTGRMNYGDQEYAIGRGIGAIRGKSGYSTSFVKAVIESNLAGLLKIATGTTFPNLGKDALNNFEVKIVNEEEAKFVGSIYQQIELKIANNTAMNQTLEKIAQRIFKSWFIDFDPVKANKEGVAFDGLSPEIQALFPNEFEESELGMVPKGWIPSTIGEEFDLVMGQSPKGTSYNEDAEGTVFFQGRRDFNFRFPSVRVYTTEPKKIAKQGDTLLSVRAPVGDVNIALEECCVGRGLAALRHKSNCSSLTYYTVANLKRIFDSFDTEGTVFGSINQKDLKSLKVIKMSEDVASAFSKVISPLDERIKQNTQNTICLERLRDRLLPKLISGQITVGEAQKELAEAI
ncbi:restriction endonuclease subunit S [Vibrio vulnificus]|nr:restriction endonuclease subunit S [Vibrio vulnificus]